MRTRINRLGFGLKALPPLSLVFFSVLIPPTPAQTIYPIQPNVPQGGRAVALAVDAYGAIVASESGGLFTTKDEGATWSYVSSLPVFRMSDIAFVGCVSRRLALCLRKWILPGTALQSGHPASWGPRRK